MDVLKLNALVGALGGYAAAIKNKVNVDVDAVTDELAIRFEELSAELAVPDGNGIGGVTIDEIELVANKGVAGGYAPLDESVKIPSAYLPSYVDDVIEVANQAALPVTGESGKIYIAADTSAQYRWSGTAYAAMVGSPGTTDDVPEGTNLYFTAERAQASVVNVTGNAGSATKLATNRAVSIFGDGSASGTFDGTANISLNLALANTGVVAGTYSKLTVDVKGRVTAGAALVAGDIPTLNQNTTGNASTSTRLQTARNINLTGDATASIVFDGSANVNAAVTLSPSVAKINSAQVWTAKQDFAAGISEKRIAMLTPDVDLALGNHFTRTVTGATSLTVSNVPAAGQVGSFVLHLTNGGVGAVTWWSGIKWNGGTAPTLTVAGRDVIAFSTLDGGSTWDGYVLGKDMK